MKLVLATHNTGKIKELSRLLAHLPIEIISQADLNVSEIHEDAFTFVENALKKAQHAARMTGLPALSDDSGLVVPQLNGAPGIYSARYAGKNATASDNIKQLLENLKDVPKEKRNAWFYCTLVLVLNEKDPCPLICEGKWHGTILTAPVGDAGFGYDPIFFIPSENKTAAELPLARKNKISHRGIALQALLTRLSEKI